MGELFVFENTHEAFKAHRFTRAIKLTVGEEEGFALFLGEVTPGVVDWEAPHRDGGQITVVRKNQGVVSESGPKVAVFRLARECG